MRERCESDEVTWARCWLGYGFILCMARGCAQDLVPECLLVELELLLQEAQLGLDVGRDREPQHLGQSRRQVAQLIVAQPEPRLQQS